MPKLITRCLSVDYKNATDNHEEHDRGELSLDEFYSALHDASYAMPVGAEPDSPHRPAVGVNIAGSIDPQFFNVSDYQGGFDLEPAVKNIYNVDDIISIVSGDKTINEIRSDKVVSNKNIKRGVYIFLTILILTSIVFLIFAKQ